MQPSIKSWLYIGKVSFILNQDLFILQCHEPGANGVLAAADEPLATAYTALAHAASLLPQAPATLPAASSRNDGTPCHHKPFQMLN